MQKKTLIKQIKRIIKDFGIFTIGEVEGTDGICINEMGGLVALAEGFNRCGIDVEVYQPSGFSSDSIESYDIDYEDLTKEQLTEILFVVEMYETDQLKTLKRISN